MQRDRGENCLDFLSLCSLFPGVDLPRSVLMDKPTSAGLPDRAAHGGDGGSPPVTSVGSSCCSRSQRDNTAMVRHRASQKEQLKLVFGIENEAFRACYCHAFCRKYTRCS